MLENLPVEDYRELSDKDLKRVHQMAEDANWHTVAGKAYQVLQERQAAGKGKVGGDLPHAFGVGSPGFLDAGDLDGKNVVITGAIEGMTRKEAGERVGPPSARRSRAR